MLKVDLIHRNKIVFFNIYICTLILPAHVNGENSLTNTATLLPLLPPVIEISQWPPENKNRVHSANKKKDHPTQLEYGDSLSTVKNAFKGFEQVEWSEFSKRYGDAICFPEMESYDCIVFISTSKLSEILGADSRPEYFIVCFSDEKKLVDLLFFIPRNPHSLVPFFKGALYNRITSLRIGMPLEQMFKIAGKIPPTEFRQSSDGSWYVEYEYSGVSGEVWTILVDGSNGTISSVSVSAI